uniref:Phosphatase PAP2 family protein n=1 Tax=Fervidobacterium nodosum TaxID=2424 RepID=A0A7C5U5L3_9BACT
MRITKLLLIMLTPFAVLSFSGEFSIDDYLLELNCDSLKLLNYIGNGTFLLEPLTLSSVLAFTVDGTINHYFPQSSFLDFLNRLNYLHFSTLAILTSIIVYPFDAYTSFTILESFVATSGVVVLLKFLVGRARPYTDNNPFTFKPFSFSEDYQSFPSGHTALSWAIFTPVALRFGDIWYAVPVVFSAQRLWSNNHWTSDVLFATSIGYNFGKTLYETKGE